MHTKWTFSCSYCTIYVLWRKCDDIEKYPLKIELIIGGFQGEFGGWRALAVIWSTVKWVSHPIFLTFGRVSFRIYERSLWLFNSLIFVRQTKHNHRLTYWEWILEPQVSRSLMKRNISRHCFMILKIFYGMLLKKIRFTHSAHSVKVAEWIPLFTTFV